MMPVSNPWSAFVVLTLVSGVLLTALVSGVFSGVSVLPSSIGCSSETDLELWACSLDGL